MDNQFYTIHSRIKNLIIKAYKEIYCLQEIENYNKAISYDKKVLPQASYDVVQFLCDLIMEDLGLSICKLLENSNHQQSNLNNMNTFLHINYPNIKHKSLNKVAPNYNKTLDNLQLFRNNYLAHNGTLQNLSIPISDLISIMKDIRNRFNSISYIDIDERATPISDQELSRIKFDISLGLGYMINKSTIPLGKDD